MFSLIINIYFSVCSKFIYSFNIFSRKLLFYENISIQSGRDGNRESEGGGEEMRKENVIEKVGSIFI